MKNIILLFLFLIPAFLFAQYPNSGNKSRLGYQTTGDGLIWRGVAADTAIKPRTTANAYFQLDTVNGVLRRYIATQGSWQIVAVTPDLTPYLLKSDTAAMLLNYPSTPGYGIIDGGKTWRADTTSPNGLATRFFTRGLSTTIASGFLATSNGTNLVARNLFDNNTVVSILNSKPVIFGSQTVAGLPTGVDGYWLDVSDYKWPARYNTTAGSWIYPTQDSRAGGIGSVNGAIHFNTSAFRTTESSTFTQLSNKLTLGVPSGKNPMVDLVVGDGDGTVNESAGLRLRNRNIDGNTPYLQLGVSLTPKGGSNQMHSYIQGGFWGGSYNNPLILQPKGGRIGIGSTLPINWELSITSNLAISAALTSTSTSNTDGGKLLFNAGTVAGTPYNSVAASIASVFDKSSWEKGIGLSFRTLSGADLSGTTTGGTERLRISSDGLFGFATNSPQRLLHVEGEARITDLTTDTPTRFVGADADGDLGAISLNSVWRDYQTDKAIIGSDSSFVHDPAVDTTRILGSMSLGKPSTFGSPTASGYQFTFRNPLDASTYMLIESGRTSPTGGNAGLRLLASGQFGAEIDFGTATSSELIFYSVFANRTLFATGLSNFVTGNKNTVLVGQIQDPIAWDYNGRFVIYDTITSGKALFVAKKVASSSTPITVFASLNSDRFTFNDDGTTRFHVYGTPSTTAATLGKTESGYLASFATDGTVLSRAANTERYNTITSTASPQTLSSTISDNLVNQGSTQATFTFRLPASPVDGQISKATFANAVTVLIIDGNGTTVTGTLPISAAVATHIIFKNYTGIGWIRQY